ERERRDVLLDPLALVNLSRHAVESLVRVLVWEEQSAPLEELDQLPAQVLVLFPGDLRIGGEFREQLRESFRRQFPLFARPHCLREEGALSIFVLLVAIHFHSPWSTNAPQ